MVNFISNYERILGKWLYFLIGVPLLFMAFVEAVNAVGRKAGFIFPCGIETVESLLVVVVYFGVTIASSERSHVTVDIIANKFPKLIQNYLTIFSDLLAVPVFAYITYGAWLQALNSVRIMDVRIGDYAYPIWFFKLIFALGLSLFMFQLLLNLIKSIHGKVNDTGGAGQKQ